MAYFLVSVSNKVNLRLCMEYMLAGFTNSISGLWTFLEIDEGDYVSFLYGARVYNLYRVEEKVAFRNAETLPPWPPITFRSGKTYYFPFRLYLRQERRLSEPMVRSEFAYVAENLLLRGGYRKTHFQADTITFYNVSSMGDVSSRVGRKLEINGNPYIPKIVFRREKQKIPEKFYFHELILQSLIRKHFSLNSKLLEDVLSYFNIGDDINNFEVLGEKALPEGHIDIFIKNKHPNTTTNKLIVEVKIGKAQSSDLKQLVGYVDELGKECKGGILICRETPKNYLKRKHQTYYS